ncbi:MAG: DinB family protein [Planctomycetota bacterium]
MNDQTNGRGFLPSFREIYTFFNGWLGELSSRFDDETALWKPQEDVNHALWLLGHITWIIDALLVEVPTGKTHRITEWDVLFKIGSERFPAERYPSFGEVREHYQRVQAAAGKHLETLGEEDLTCPCHVVSDWFKTPVDAMLSFLRDANYHLGQMSILFKLLGKKGDQGTRASPA